MMLYITIKPFSKLDDGINGAGFSAALKDTVERIASPNTDPLTTPQALNYAAQNAALGAGTALTLQSFGGNLPMAATAVTTGLTAMGTAGTVLTIDAKQFIGDYQQTGNINYQDLLHVAGDVVTMAGDASLVTSAIANINPETKALAVGADIIGDGLTVLGLAIDHLQNNAANVTAATFDQIASAASADIKSFEQLITQDFASTSGAYGDLWNTASPALFNSLTGASNLLSSTGGASFSANATNFQTSFNTTADSLGGFYAGTGAAPQSVNATVTANSINVTDPADTTDASTNTISYSADGMTTQIKSTVDGATQTENEVIGTKGAVVNLIQDDYSDDTQSCTATIDSNMFTDTILDTKATVNAIGNVTFTAPTSGNNTATMKLMADDTDDTFTVGKDKIDFSADPTSLSGNGGDFTFGLNSSVSGASEGIEWNSNTGKAVLDLTGTGDALFQSSLGYIDPGDTLEVGGSAISDINKAGKVLDSTKILSDGDQLDTSYNYSGGMLLDTVYDYSLTGLLDNIDWDNITGSVADYYADGDTSDFLAQKITNPAGAGSITANNQSVIFSDGVTPTVTVSATGSDVYVSTSDSGNLLDLSSGGITVNVNGVNFSDSLQNTHAILDSSNSVQLTSILANGDTGNLLVDADGNATFQDKQDTLQLGAGALQGISTNSTTGTVDFSFQASSGNTALLDWNPTTGKATLTVDGFSSSMGNIDPGDTLQVAPSTSGYVLSLQDADGVTLNSTEVDTSTGDQIDTSYNNTGTGDWQDTKYTYNSAGQNTAIAYDNFDAGSQVQIFDPSTGVLTEVDQFNADGTQNITYYDPDSGAWEANDDVNTQGDATLQGVSTQISSAQFAQTTINTLAEQAISQFLLKNDLPASMAAQALSHASIDLALGTQGSYSFTGGQALTNSQAFLADYSATLSDMAGGFLGSEAIGALLQDLGVTGIPAQLLTSAGSVLGSTATGELTDYIAINVFDITESSALNIVDGALPDFTSSLASAGVSALGSFVGSEFATLLTGNDNIGSEIGGDVLGAAGAIIGSVLPGLGTFLGTAIGDFLGSLIGGIFGSGYRGKPLGLGQVALRNGQFAEIAATEDNNGNVQVGVQMGNATFGILNNILDSIGGTASSSIVWNVGYLGNSFFSNTAAQGGFDNWFSSADDAVADAVVNILDRTQITGGNPYMEYALVEDEQANQHLATMLNDLNVAYNYSQYAANELGFNIAVSSSTDPNQIQTWLAELQRAENLGLDKLSIVGDPMVVENDTAANVIGKLPALEVMAQSGLLDAITFTDAGIPSLIISGAQLIQDHDALNKINTAYNETVLIDNNLKEALAGSTGGNNSISFANAIAGVIVNLATGTAQVADVVKGKAVTLTDTISNFQTVIGSAYSDTLTAGAGGETLIGSGGADTLIGSKDGNDTFEGTAANLSSSKIETFAATDKIDITDHAFTASTAVTFTPDGKSKTSGTLNVSDSSGTIAQIYLQGKYVSFAVSSDGMGGILMTDPPLKASADLLVQSMASFNTTPLAAVLAAQMLPDPSNQILAASHHA